MLNILRAVLVEHRKSGARMLGNFAEALLDCLGSDETVLGWDGRFTVLQEVGDKLSHFSTGDRDVADGVADWVTVDDWDDVSDTVTAVNDGTGHGAVALARPRGGKRKHGLHTDVKIWHVECLEHDFRCVLSVVW